MSSPRKRSRPCRFHNNGGCKKRSDECAYDHVKTSSYKEYLPRTNLTGSYRHRSSPRSERNYDVSKADDNVSKRYNNHRRHPGEYRRHREHSKYHHSPGHRDQDLRKQSECSNLTLNPCTDEGLPEAAKSNLERKSYFNSPAILRNYFSNEDVTNDIIGDQIRSEKLFQNIEADQLDSDHAAQNKICKICFTQYNWYSKEEGEICIPCQNPLKITRQQTDMPSNSKTSSVNATQPTNYVPNMNTSKLLTTQESLDSISEDALSEDEGTNIRIKSEIGKE